MENENSRKLQSVLEKIACIILMLWCSLPLGMVVYCLIAGSVGAFPSLREITGAGAALGNIYYTATLDAYRLLFQIIGIAAVIFAVLIFILNIDRIFSKANLKKYLWAYLLLALLIWSVICSLLSDDFPRAFFGEYYLNDGLYSYFIYAAFFICALVIKKEKQRRLILRYFVAVAAILSVIMIIQVSGNDFINYCFPSGRAVVYNQFNHFGYVLCMAIMAAAGLFLYDENITTLARILYGVLIALFTYTLLINNTFGAFIGALVGMIVIYIFYAKSGHRFSFRALIPAIIFVIISAANCFGLTPGAATLLGNLTQFGSDVGKVVTDSEDAAMAGTGRMVLWKSTIEHVAERPVFGFGPQGFYGKNSLIGGDSNSPHNEYLQIAGFLGIPGLILYLAALISILISQWKKIKGLSPMVLTAAGISVGYLASAAFGNPVFNTAPFFWIFLGLTVSGSENEDSLISSDITSKNLKQRIIIPPAAAAACIAAIIIAAYDYEFQNENADLLAMRCAAVTGQMKLEKWGIEEKEEFWFDADSFNLIPIDDKKPEAYGCGTYLTSSATEHFAAEYGVYYIYGITNDYTAKVLKVTVDPDKNMVDLSWVK